MHIRMVQPRPTLLVLALIMTLAACTTPTSSPGGTGNDTSRRWRIGMSQANNAEPWRQAMNAQIAAAAARHPNIQIEFTDAR